LTELRQDAAMGARLLSRSPGFAASAILTLALGVGANVTIYGGLDAALLRPLPYPSPDRLVLVSETREDGGQNRPSVGAFLDWRSSPPGQRWRRNERQQEGWPRGAASARKPRWWSSRWR
jgi:hypothetical protein